MRIKPDDLVLEVGSGGLPYYRSDVLLDKFPDNSTERLGDLVIDRPLVVANAEALPFADKSFNYIIASHVLEHSPDPGKFLDELSRVGERGYIETPASLRERVFDWPFHRWYIYQKNEKLFFIKKTEKSNRFFAGMRAEDRSSLYFLEGKDFFNIRFEWAGKIDYQIIESEPEDFLIQLDKKLVNILKTRWQDPTYWQTILKTNAFKLPGVAKTCLYFKTWLTKAPKAPNDFIARKFKNKIDIFSLLVCPACKRKLVTKLQAMRCSSCGRKFTFYSRAGRKFPNLSLEI